MVKPRRWDIAALALTVLLSVPISLAHAPQVAAQRPAPAPPRVLFLGDFLTWGYAASDASHSFAVQVAARLGAVRVGYDGEYGGMASVAAQMLTAHPPPSATYVIVELGTRDTESLATFTVAYFAILSAVNHAAPRAHLLCLGPWQGPLVGDRGRYWGAIQPACRALGGVPVNLSPIFQNPVDHAPSAVATYRGPADPYYPNDAGHAAIAQAVLAALS